MRAFEIDVLSAPVGAGRVSGQRGWSLIELMLGLSLGLIVLSAAIGAMTSAKLAQRALASTSLLQDGQMVLDLMAQHLRMAGYSRPRINADVRTTNSHYTGLAVRGCDNGFFTNGRGAGALEDLSALVCSTQAIGGGHSGRDHLSGSSLALVYEADTANTVPTKTDPSYPVDCAGFAIKAATASPWGGNYYLANNRFYVDANRSLSCVGNGGDATPSWTSTPMVAGVEDLVLRYGVMQTASAGSLGVAVNTGAVSRYMSATELDTDPELRLLSPQERWRRVGAVRVCVIMSTDDNAASQATPYADCDGVLRSPSDKRHRLVLQTTVALRNALGALGASMVQP